MFFQQALKGIIICLFISSIFGCTTNTPKHKPGTARLAINPGLATVLPHKELRQESLKIYANTIKNEHEKKRLIYDTNKTLRYSHILSRLSPHTGIFILNAPNWRWNISVLKSGELDAWAMPGGYVAITTGFADKLKFSDDELAAVLGHVIAHIVLYHDHEYIAKQLKEKLDQDKSGTPVNSEERSRIISDLIKELTFHHTYSNDQEEEADEAAIEIMSRAGFNPKAAITAWKKLEKYSQDHTIELFAAHPYDSSRVDDFEDYIEKYGHFYNYY